MHVNAPYSRNTTFRAMLRKAFAATFWMVATTCVFAQEFGEDEDVFGVYGGDDLISLATGRSQPLSRAPAVATVITAEQIREIGATTVEEVLETVPGIHVGLSTLGYSPIISIRGIYSDENPQVLMLMNGVPMTRLFLGNRGFRPLMGVETIQRIEIIRGPGSAIYGAEAVAGVINIITKTADDIDGVDAGMRYGSFDSTDGWFNAGGTFGELKAAVNVEFQATDGDSARKIDSDAQTIFDREFGTHASHAPGDAETDLNQWDIHLDLSYDKWNFHAWHATGSGGTGPGTAQALDPSGEAKLSDYMLNLRYHDRELAENWEFSVGASYIHYDTNTENRLFPDGALVPIGADGNINTISPTGLALFPDGVRGNPDTKEDHYRLEAFTFYRGFSDHVLRIAGGINYAELKPHETKNFGPGVLDGTALLPPPNLNVVSGDLTNVTNTPYNFMRQRDRTNLHISLQDEWSFAPDWDLVAGVRYDHYSDFGDTINPRIALIWETRYDLTSKLLYGRAFRAPSFSELYTINNPVRLGNPNLDPENINYLELALDYRPTFDLRTGLSVYGYQIDDQIRFVPDASGSATAQNTGRQRAYGFEVEANWRITHDFSLNGNYAFLHAQDEKADMSVGLAPKHQVYLNGKWFFRPQWLLSGEVLWIGPRDRAPGDPRSSISDYTMVDFTLRRRNIYAGLSAAVLVKNLFDNTPLEPSPGNANIPGGALIPGDFPRAGRYIGGELRFEY